MTPKTIIGKARELVAEFGSNYAIKYFQDKIDDLGQPKNFDELCKQSGWETAIEFIKGDTMISNYDSGKPKNFSE